MYQVKDSVIYGIQGICEIESIEEKDFGGQKKMYYVLKPVYQRTSTVYVPMDNEKTVAKMRKVLSKDEIMRLIHGMTDEVTKWIENDALRKERFGEIIRVGDREELIALIKAVYYRKQTLIDEGKKKLHVADENAMKEAEKVLYDEFAYVLGIERTEVLSYIVKCIEENK